MTGSNTNHISEDDLLRFVDGELTKERHSQIETYLADHPDLAARVAEDRAVATNLRRAFDGLATQITAPSPALTPHRPRPAYLAMAASLVAALALGGVIGWAVRPVSDPQPQSSFLADAFAAHRTFVVEVAHPVEVTAKDKGHLATWLSNRLGRPFVVPDLRVAGLALMGGRLLPSAQEPAAQLMYQDQAGARVTLYLRRGNDRDPSFRFEQTATEQAFYWSDTEFGYALTGSLTRERLLDIAHLLQAQFQSPDAAL